MWIKGQYVWTRTDNLIKKWVFSNCHHQVLLLNPLNLKINLKGDFSEPWNTVLLWHHLLHSVLRFSLFMFSVHFDALFWSASIATELIWSVLDSCSLILSSLKWHTSCYSPYIFHIVSGTQETLHTIFNTLKPWSI